MRDIYEAAKDFLIQKIPTTDAESILNHYLSLPDRSSSPVTLNEIYKRLLGSAQNSNMKAGVIGGSIDGFDNLRLVLFDFHPSEVSRKFSDQPNKLLDAIVQTLNPRGAVRRTPRSIWPKYCRTILSSAIFLEQFENGEDFYSWANHLYKDHRSMAALPMILAAEIDGLGYTLACDFLKELGFINYGKPDVHVVEIFAGLGLCSESANPYNVQKVITEIAHTANVSSYNVDKLFWLIGSGKLYDHPQVGNNGFIGRHKAKFLAFYNA